MPGQSDKTLVTSNELQSYKNNLGVHETLKI